MVLHKKSNSNIPFLEEFNFSKPIKKNSYISSGKINSLAVLIVAKVLFNGSLAIDKNVFDKEYVKDIDIEDKEKEEVAVFSNQFIEKIDEILKSYDISILKRAKRRANQVLYAILKHKNLDNPVSLIFLAVVLLFTYFVEGQGKRSDCEFDFFKEIKRYDNITEKYEQTKLISFINDQEICIDALLEL